MNGWLPDVPPPGDGFCTWILTVDAVVKSLAGICAVTPTELTTVVDSGVPFQTTCAPFTNEEPVTVIVVAGSPVVAPEGDMAVSCGVGLSTSRLVGVPYPLFAGPFDTTTANSAALTS